MNVWEQLIRLFIQMDIGNRIFEEALRKIGEYLKDLSESTRMQAQMACGDAADYCAPFDSFQPKIRGNADSLCTMRGYLRQQPQTEAVLRQTYQMNCLSHLLGKQIDYLALNQFTLESELTEAEAAIFQNMLEKLKQLGYDDDMFEAFVGKIERNVEISGKQSRLERSELWTKADL